MSLQTERIEHMEALLNEGSAMVTVLEQALNRYEELLPGLEELFSYYGSPLWFSDLADDAAGRLPCSLPRGVLSEDAVYDLISELAALRERIFSLGQKISGHDTTQLNA